MRDLKILIQLLIDRLDCYGQSGMCIAITSMERFRIITENEAMQLRLFIKLAEPKFYQKRYYCSGGKFDNKFRYYYWTPGDIKPRIKWLQKQLNKL